MTMAKVENGSVTEVGLPEVLKSYGVRRLKSMGWYPVEGTPKPTTGTAPGYHWEYGASWSEQDGKVVGQWNEVQRPQLYPSWTWADGEGWVPPVAYPTDGGDYYWDEGAGDWLQDAI